MTDERKCVLYLAKRMGFIKLALRHGVPVVPVFSFGLRNQYRYWVPKNKFIINFGRKIGVIPMIFFGMFGLPFAPPSPCQYVNVVGAPIKLPRIIEPTDEDVSKYHAIYCDALTKLFDGHKNDYNQKEVTLVIA